MQREIVLSNILNEEFNPKTELSIHKKWEVK